MTAMLQIIKTNKKEGRDGEHSSLEPPSSIARARRPEIQISWTLTVH